MKKIRKYDPEDNGENINPTAVVNNIETAVNEKATDHSKALEEALIKSMRLRCTADAPVVTAYEADYVDEKYIDSVGVAGIFIPDDCHPDNAQKIIKNTECVIFHEFNPLNRDSYTTNIDCYLRREEEKKLQKKLAGPGMITILATIDYLDDYIEFYNDAQRIYSDAHRRSSEEQNDFSKLKELLEQPVVVNVNALDEIKNPEIEKLIKMHVIEGLIFNKQKDLLQFQQSWEKKKRGSIVERFRKFHQNLYSQALKKFFPKVIIPQTKIAHEKISVEPHLILKGTANDIKQFFEQGYQCDGWIVTDILTPELSDTITGIRIAQIVQRHSRPILKQKSDKHTLQVGIVGLQGAYKLEKELLDSLNFLGEELPYEIVSVLVHTKHEMANLDGIILGGGWHVPQLKLYPDRNLQIIEGVEEMIKQGRDAFFSCAGLIIARSPDKPSYRCSNQQPAGFLDVGLTNNDNNGVKMTIIHKNGEKTEEPGKYVGAPSVTTYNINKPGFSVVAELTNNVVVAVEQIDQNTGSILIGTAFHNRSIMLRWLNKIFYKRMQRVEQSVIESGIN